MLVAADAGCALISGAHDGPPPVVAPLVTLAVVVDIAMVVDEAVVDTATVETTIRLLRI